MTSDKSGIAAMQTVHLLSSFTWRVVHVDRFEIVVVIDLDRGCSVTNDAAAVLAYIASQLGGLPNRPVMYRDTAGWYDGLGHNGWAFTGLYPIRAETEELAIGALALPGCTCPGYNPVTH